MIKKQKTRACNGFTLVELMAVALLIALVSGFGLASYATSYKKWAIEQNAREFYLMAKYARLHAIEHQTSCQLIIDQEQKRFYLAESNESEYEMEEEVEEIIKNPLSQPKTLADHVQFEKVQKVSVGDDDGEGLIKFSPNGTAEHVRVQIGDGKTHFTIAVSGATGRTQIIEGEIDDAQPDQVDLDLE